MPKQHEPVSCQPEDIHTARHSHTVLTLVLWNWEELIPLAVSRKLKSLANIKMKGGDRKQHTLPSYLWVVFLFCFFETVSHFVVQACLELTM